MAEATAEATESQRKSKCNDRVAGVCHQITKRLFTAENAEKNYLIEINPSYGCIGQL
jgi:hypothetical protein